ncbi:4-hydroxyphenylpyruvate dioxygenase [Sinorhizobium meliloti]|uniref:bifunctional sugar phosphate isomerase/epimerase/4-hydroxyphenylpyruvate dioxygenase family protein n=1 Tax=Rhizobium meliloti TaxID=382 RepID=UPI000FD36994|nr:bifunctional sugar phosphate isomerase/epimerase/4-hydroxyphenylpyruvate dioxygenase family protein [Sinorhizobium meliloti]MDW9739402.1 TIM barrel protein [Sinorhizobium meliloti]MDW9813583.1 TIM barrel protein [Sinorhizobium meliloti]MDX0260136.1 TIM barrel protein [Sinorhizobium meliloti]MDX0347133.1 TIM barrel protein [Sinorhizobium meliloti]QPI29339.1 bifunctional sugar phosphate isomerase/epimerase/4-hydroxyphenylpyruvate dioxygenase family protein [Sinorhizobium meliloti]
MKTSIATVSISGTLSEKLAAVAASGFDGVEIFENDFLTFDGSPAEVGRMVRDHGLEVTLFQPFRDFEGLPEPHRSRAFDRAERKFDVMQELGTELMLVCSSVSPLALGGIDRAADDLRELGERAAKRGLRVGYEALAWGRHVNDHRDAWEIVRRADHPNIGLILDSFHTLSRNIDLRSIRSIPGDRIFIVQLADAPRIEMDLLYLSRHFRNMPGEGDLPVVDFMQAVAATGYDGALSLEIFNDQFRGGSPRAIAEDGHRSLVYLMDRVKRREPVAKSALAMPDRVEVLGVEFVEFTADRAEAETLGSLLGTMGFHAVASHREKSVTLWRQGRDHGGVNIVINTEQQGFSRSSYLVHGASAYAVGLKVPDASAAIERSRALGAEIFLPEANEGEGAMAAIRGIGGGLIYFLDEADDVWSREFVRSGATPQGASPLLAIDHVAQSMQAEELPSWLLFYTSILDADKLAEVDIVDPAGLIRSQVVENASGTLRLTLNGADNHRTLAGHFIAESFGSGVQHVAFRTDDIIAAADHMRRSGLRPLAISRNYYDDIEVRFGLEPDFVDRLRDESILYDRDEDGEYFQIYGPTYGEGFFFEIVERRAGYRGYGAANAPFRIAAQKRSLRPAGMPAL